MARVLTFSRTFPVYHPKAGEPTYFVEKYWNSFNVEAFGETFLWDGAESDEFKTLNAHLPFKTIIDFKISLRESNRQKLGIKGHTIRKGNRWKPGDYFSPRVWSGIPYHSKQIILGRDIEVKKVWNIEIFTELGSIYIGIRTSDNSYGLLSFGEVAKNDGLIFTDMRDWFNVKPDKPFVGQIICWAENINY